MGRETVWRAARAWALGIGMAGALACGAGEAHASGGGAWFPLEEGNRWTLESALGERREVRCSKALVGSVSFFDVEGLLGPGTAELTTFASEFPGAVFIWSGSGLHDLLPFDLLRAGGSWRFQDPTSGCYEMLGRFGGTDETVRTPAGTFGGAALVRFEPPIRPGGPCDLSRRAMALWFAAGVGPVRIETGDGRTFDLIAAEVGGASVGLAAGPNTIPVAIDDDAVTREDVGVRIEVLANDTDADGDPLEVGAVTSPRFGSLAIAPDGRSITYHPNATFYGSDTFTYTARDRAGESAPATVRVTVRPFYPTFTRVVGPEGYGLRAGDFDADGRPDLAGARSNQVWTWLNRTERSGELRLVEGPRLFGTLRGLGDLDGDGRSDLVVGTTAFTGFTMLSRASAAGPAEFERGPSFDYLLHADDRYLIADVNGDGHGDAVGFVVTLGRGGDFTRPGTTTELDGHRAAVADLNLDGRPDVVTTYQGDVSFWPNDMPRGAMTPRFGAPTAEKLSASLTFAVGDVDGDGLADFICLERNADAGLYVLLNRTAPGSASLSFEKVGPLEQVPGHQRVAVGDVNADGRPDIVTRTEMDIVVLYGLPSAAARAPSFSAPVPLRLDARGGSLVLEDFDGDGRVDIATEQAILLQD